MHRGISLDRLVKSICSDIENELSRIGILCRIFGRAKTLESIEKKQLVKKYSNDSGGKLMQDLIGVRVVVYFKDDLPIVKKVLKSYFKFVDETIDEISETVFEPNRINLIFKLNDNDSEEVKEQILSLFNFIDSTFEVQLRTILSEGWHEIEHDLRYKCSDDWNGFSELSRTFNGIYAALETSDWSILSLFDQLAYQQYKGNNVSAMIRNKFRIRFSNDKISNELLDIIQNEDKRIIKQIFKIDRIELLNKLFDDGERFPLTITNLVFYLNREFLENEKITKITPDIIIKNDSILI